MSASAPPLSGSLMSTLTASVSSRARAEPQGRVWPSVWHPAQRGEPWSRPGWAGVGGQPGQRPAEFRSSSRGPCVLPGGGSPWGQARVGAGMWVSVQVVPMVGLFSGPRGRLGTPVLPQENGTCPAVLGGVACLLWKEPVFKPQAPSRGRRSRMITAHSTVPPLGPHSQHALRGV